MREFYFKDKKTNAAYRGVVPHNDVDCPPFDYFRFLHAEMCFKNFSWMLSVKCPIKMPKDAQELGYLLDIYHEETYPEKFNEKKKPVVYSKKDDGTIDALGTTDMTEGELRALLEQRKVVQARIYHKNEHWQ